MVGKTPLVKGFLKNNFTLDPRRFFRKQSVSEFLAGPGRNFYSPNSGGVLASIGNIGVKDNPRFSGGMLGRMGALAKTERRAAAGKLSPKMDLNTARIFAYNNPKAALINKIEAPVGQRLPAVRDPVTGRFVKNPLNFTEETTRLGALVNRAQSGARNNAWGKALFNVTGR